MACPSAGPGCRAACRGGAAAQFGGNHVTQGPHHRRLPWGWPCTALVLGDLRLQDDLEEKADAEPGYLPRGPGRALRWSRRVHRARRGMPGPSAAATGSSTQRLPTRPWPGSWKSAAKSGPANASACTFIPPGEPWPNGYIESFNSRLRDECLNIIMIWSLARARGSATGRRTTTTAGDTSRSATRRQLSTLRPTPIHDPLSLTAAPMSRASVGRGGCILGRPVGR